MKTAVLYTSVIALTTAMSSPPAAAGKLGERPASVATRVHAAPGDTLAQRHAAAMRDLRSGRYASAYGSFAQLADEGHAPSAPVALLMVHHGASLFGSAWSATPGQLRRWSAMSQLARADLAAQLADHDRGE